MSNTDLIIIGAGGHGKVVADVAINTGKYENIYFMDDYSSTNLFYGFKNLGETNQLYRYKNSADVFVAIGSNDIRKKKLEKLLADNYHVPTLVHSSAIISKNTEIDRGTVIMPAVVINSSTKIGLGAIINTNSNIDHDCKVGDFTHVSPGVSIAGSVKIGKECWIGINSTIINKISINDGIVVGAGSVVIKNIKERGTYIGSPARRIK
ncbi:acetyltransferase [Aerococcus urinaeequi]|uniref:Acetyltransferase n=1 Tax=Aerococcus urinaeequi TaxID=51665 RepID=A0A7M1KQS5_9LACT|nr:acetyltransferase [Aerococcus urinaeequi]QOQ78667.1 acetyltransferase [Aerococcus urinaeequi]